MIESNFAISTRRLVLAPALITLAITLVRLVGEVNRWSPAFFNREAGGGGALIGIVWLVPILGVYFGLRPARASRAGTPAQVAPDRASPPARLLGGLHGGRRLPLRQPRVALPTTGPVALT